MQVIASRNRILAINLFWGLICLFSSTSESSVHARSIDKGQVESPFLNFDDSAELDNLNAQIDKALQLKQFQRALPLAKKALELSAVSFGKEHYQYARALNNLGYYTQNNGDYAEARRYFEQALAIMESSIGKDNPKLVPVLNNLSILLAAQGDPINAAPLLERALLLEEKVVGSNSVDLASTLNNLAVIYDAAGLHKESRGALERAYTIQQSDDEHCDPLERALTLSNLALLSQTDGDLKRAETLMKEAYALRAKTMQMTDPDLAESLTNLGVIELRTGNLKNASEHFQEALSIMRTAFTLPNVELVQILNNLASVELAQSTSGGARKYCLEACSILNKHINDVLPGLSFAEQRRFLSSRLPEQIGLLISTSRSVNDAQVSYDFLFRWKGLLIESLRRQSQMELLSKDPAYLADVQELIALRHKLAELFHKSGQRSFADWQSMTAELLLLKEKLERKISGGPAAVSVQDVLANFNIVQFSKFIQPDEVLVDFYYFKKHSANLQSEHSYAAFILDGSGNARLVELGSANEINQIAKSWLHHTINRQFAAASADMLLLKSKFSKLEIDASRKVFVCADSELNRIPLSQFIDCQLMANLDAPRELAYLRLPASQSLSNHFLAVGGVNYGQQQDQNLFSALPASGREVDELAALARNEGLSVEILKGEDASKTRVLSELSKAQSIHIATHGFFSDSGLASRSYALESSNPTLSERSLIRSRDPLMKSGLVFSSSASNSSSNNPNSNSSSSNSSSSNNSSSNNSSSGVGLSQSYEVLDAEELLNTDLHNCNSMVLSACETGLGEKDNGQGVLGLRAAIMAAGARMVLISLWKVPDAPTVVFMEEFYKNMWQKKQSPALALKNARDTMAKHSTFNAPADWGAWILLGKGW